MIRRHSGSFTWDGVDIHPYKEEGGTHFRSITRQTLHKGTDDLPVEFRYFEIQQGGHSTLERHVHQHVVMIIRGSGHVLVGDTITPIAMNDLVHIPPMTWHQFRPNEGNELGFLCVVSSDRDKPQRPNSDDLGQLRATKSIDDFIRV
jgi:mannose-6-phosphate isomerase-like protein (cupin superfamily)